jgi:hypothetical protein
VLFGLGLALGILDAYLLVLLAAASWPRAHRPQQPSAGGGRLRFRVLVPAHDEEQGLADTLAALDRTTFPDERWGVLVVADNCSDGTAEVARQAGAAVLERSDPGLRGKGHALNWALERLPKDYDAIAVLDADCQPSPNWLTALEGRLLAGAPAAQVRYTVANPSASRRTALQFAAFALMNTVRPLGKERIGLSCGLMGTGMAFRAGLLEAHGFNADSLVEDSDLHLRLVAAGERVSFAPEAYVQSAMPPGARAASSQQRRWEGGRAQLIRDWSARLLVDGVRRRDALRIHAALEHLVPPQTLLAFAHVVLAGLSCLGRSPAVRRLAVVTVAMQALFVVGGLRLARAPREVYAALLTAPILVARKLGLLAGLALRGAPRSWERTARDDDAGRRRAGG